MFACTKSSIKKNTCHCRERLHWWLSLLLNIELCFTYKKQSSRVVFHWFLAPTWNKLSNGITLYLQIGLLTNIKICYKRNRRCHHCLATMSAHTHAYRCPLEGNLVCEQSRYMYKRYISFYINTKNNSKIDYSYSNNWSTADYGESINSVL